MFALVLALSMNAAPPVKADPLEGYVPKGYYEQVRKELKRVGAKVGEDDDKKPCLVTKKGKVIVFRVTPHWGNPPVNYREIIRDFHKESQKLRKAGKYVIELRDNRILP
jgi:uncharacterized membrane protein